MNRTALHHASQAAGADPSEPIAGAGADADPSGAILGTAPALVSVLARAHHVAATRVPVLVTGETGTGKDLLARLIHDRGPRRHRPYVAVNCGTLSRELADSALFGHERGAFTGATGRRAGWFEEADRGTLVLDEIGELPLELQSKLLRVLETGRLRRVGGAGEIAVDVRLIAVTWRDLRAELGHGTFRADLFHRLSAFELSLPPLRDRPQDIPCLVDRFLSDLAPEIGRRTIDREALGRLMAHRWPGNIRELRNVVTRATILSESHIGVGALDLPDERPEAGRCDAGPPRMPPVAVRPRLEEPEPRSLGAVGDGPRAPGPEPVVADTLRLGDLTLAEIERSVFAWALRRHGGSRRRAARALAVPRSTFCDRARRYGLS